MENQVELESKSQTKLGNPAVKPKSPNGESHQNGINQFGVAEHVTLESSLLEKDYAHAVHCMVWSKWEEHFVLEEFKPYAAILMQMRFDGCIGFPGGMIDEEMSGISVEQAENKCLSALTRELAEEMNVDFLRHSLKKEDYLFSYRHPSKKLFLHLYTFELTMDGIREVENMALKSMDFGNEVFGVVRVPLYTMTDGYRGFPAFLNHNFIQCSRQQLLEGLEAKSIMPKNLISEAIDSSRENRSILI